MDGVVQPVFQALLCLASIAAIRAAIIQLGPSVGAILMGTPMIMFPLLAIQAWQGPPGTQAQTIGSIASMTALNGALWLYRLPIRFTTGTALLAFALGWLAVVMLVYLAEPRDCLMAGFLLLNGLSVLIGQRHHRATAVATKGRITDGAIVTAAFLIFFFLVTRLIPDFLRGLLVAFPVGVFATIYFVRRILPLESFRGFIVYTQGSVTAGAMFVLFVHYSLMHMPIALAPFKPPRPNPVNEPGDRASSAAAANRTSRVDTVGSAPARRSGSDRRTWEPNEGTPPFGSNH